MTDIAMMPGVWHPTYSATSKHYGSVSGSKATKGIADRLGLWPTGKGFRIV
jgi:hypothetical protein